MRIDPETCRDPDLLAAEVRRLEAVITAGESARLSQKCDCPKQDNTARQDILTGEEREASAGSHNTHMATARLSAANTWLQEEIKRLRLTDAERDAIKMAIMRERGEWHGNLDYIRAATLQLLLERTQ
jgi:hypothetical protein